MILRHALSHLLLHGHAIGKVLLGHGFFETTLQRLVLEHLGAHLPRRQKFLFVRLLAHVGLRLRKRHGSVRPEFIGHFLHDARHGLNDLFARSFHGTLKKTLGYEHALLARDRAGLVTEENGQRLHVDDRIRRHFLRRVRQDGVMARDLAARRSPVAVTHLVHIGLLALKQQ